MNILPCSLDAGHRSMVVAEASSLSARATSACAAAAVTTSAPGRATWHSCRRVRPARCRGSVYVVEPIGEEVFVDVLIGDARVWVRAERGWTAPIGTPVGVRVDPAQRLLLRLRRPHRRPPLRGPGPRRAGVAGAPAPGNSPHVRVPR